MAAWSSGNIPRSGRRRVSLQDKVPTALRQAHNFGVRRKTNRGCRANQTFTAEIVVASVSTVIWTILLIGASASMTVKKRMNSSSAACRG
jgi:hypothetical protein